MKTERKVNLEITVCVNCNKEPITKDTFPHYGPKCMAYLKKHGRLPEPETDTEQIGFKGDLFAEIPEEN